MRISVLAHRLDSLFFLKNSFSDSLYYLIPKGHPWLTEVLKNRNTIQFETDREMALEDVSDDDIIKNSNITAQLKKYRINSFVISHRGSQFIHRWSKDNSITLIGTSPKHQIYFEHKIHFDTFLKKLSLPSPKSKVIKGGQRPFRPPFVIQEPTSFGSFGTFIIKNDKEWAALRTVLSESRSYLAREFIAGPSYGITIYIDNFRIALSALRQQCFFRGSSIFAGIQWKRTDAFKKKTIEHLNRSLLHLGCKLQDEGFFGFANIDFIITKDGNISILECNPRLSSASPHLFGVPETFGAIPVTDLYLSMGEFQDPPPFFFFAVPQSTFEGSLLDIINTSNGTIPVAHHSSGTYSVQKNITLLSPTIPDLTSSKEIFFYYDHVLPLNHIPMGSQSGTVISNFPLFNNQGTLNEHGQNVHSNFLDDNDR